MDTFTSVRDFKMKNLRGKFRLQKLELVEAYEEASADDPSSCGSSSSPTPMLWTVWTRPITRGSVPNSSTASARMPQSCPINCATMLSPGRASASSAHNFVMCSHSTSETSSSGRAGRCAAIIWSSAEPSEKPANGVSPVYSWNR